MVSRKLALIIGNSEYEDANLARLVTPDSDVQALAGVLRDPGVGGFDAVTALVNEPSTTVRRAISSFFTGQGRDDLLLLYFSGHGIRDDRGQLFLAVKDTENRLLRGTAIPAAFITEEMDNSRSRRQILILDCCHSGAFSHGMKAATGASVGTAAAFEGTGSGRVVLTATDSTQYAWEGDRVIGQAENSVFTHYLIRGLRTGEADTDADGLITLDELYNYVYEQVVDETPLQTPGKWSYGQRGEIVIAKNPRPVLKPAELPHDLVQTVEDPRPWVREGAVQELDRILNSNNPGLALAAQEALKRLAQDDSRRVAGLAAERLAAYGEAQLVGDKNLAVEAAPTLPYAREEPGSRVYERPERSAGVQERDKESVERTGKILPGRGTPPVRVAGERSWSPELLITAGLAVCWAFGWVLSEKYGWYSETTGFVWMMSYAIGGLVTGLVLMRTERSLQWKHLLVITAGWTVGSFFTNASFTEAVNGAIHGFFSGLIIGLVLLWAGRSIHPKHVLVITIGWMIGMGLNDSIGNTLYDVFKRLSGNIWMLTIPAAISMIIGGAIGSSVMYWQIREAARQTGTDER